MIAFKDFVPKDETRFLAMSRKYETLEEAVGRANDWIVADGIEVLNVETILLPGLKKEGDTDAPVTTEANLLHFQETSWMQVVRVWYRSQ